MSDRVCPLCTGPHHPAHHLEPWCNTHNQPRTIERHLGTGTNPFTLQPVPLVELVCTHCLTE